MAGTSGDQLLVERVQRGDRRAFDLLVLKYQQKILKLVMRYVRDPTEALDVSQEAFVKAYRALPGFRGESAFYTWLYRIAINTALTHLRKNRFRTFFSLERVAEGEKTPDWMAALTVDASVEKESVVRDLQQRLNEAFQKLSINHRTVVTLFEIDGLSHTEIAEIMGCSVGTVRSRLHYAKQQLQAELQDLLS